MKDMSHIQKQETADSCIANGCSNDTEENHYSQSDSTGLRVSVDAMGTDTDGMSEFNKQGSTVDKVSDNHKSDGLQELLQLAQEFETQESVHGKEVPGARKEDKEVACSQDMKLTSSVSEGEASGTGSSLETKSTPKCVPQNLESRHLNCGQSGASINKKSSRNASLASITVGPSRSQFTIPQPFSLATDKRALGGGRAKDAEGVPSHKALEANGTLIDTCVKVPELSRKPGPRLHVAKSIRSESFKYGEDALKKLGISEAPEHRDEDAMSIYSTKSCQVAPKIKASRFTNTSSFRFQTDARAEKRKEYYAKLQERLIAKEDERNQMQEKAKKEREEEIKRLRKSLTFKAHPIPSFYQEGPPQKAELPKTPITRARSPKFSRRESSLGGASTRLCNIIKCEAEDRNSLSPRKAVKGYNIELRGSSDLSEKSMEGKPSAKSAERNMVGEGNMISSACASGVSVMEDFSADVHAKVRDPLIISSELMMSDEEESAHLVQKVESECMPSEGGDEFYHDDATSVKSIQTEAVPDLCVRPGCQVKASNVSRGQANTNARVLSSSSNNKTKNVKKAQPLGHEGRNDPCTNEGNQSSTKNQRYKASTPYFRKHESRGNERQSAANKETILVKPSLTVQLE